MAINVLPTGPYNFSTFGVHTQTSFATYSYFSGEIVTTNSFEDSVLDFGAGLAEIWIVNTGGGMIAFQFPEKYISTVPATTANIASGIVLSGTSISFRRANKRGMKLRSAVDGAPGTVYVFGI